MSLDDGSDAPGFEAADVHEGARPLAMHPDVMSAVEVARFLGLSRNSVYDGANRGEIPCRRVGRRLLFSRSALVLWLRHERAVSESESRYAGIP